MSNMPLLFISANQIKDNAVLIEEEDAHYLINVLRLTRTDKIKLRDGSNQEYTATIDKISTNQITATISEKKEIHTEMPCAITLAQGLPKADKMELIIQKSVELGVYQITPLHTERCIVKVSQDKQTKKNERWNSIAKAAAAQSGRGIIPKITAIKNLQEIAQTFSSFDSILIPWEGEDMNSLKNIEDDIKQAKSILVIIGPEGGLTQTEIALFKEHGGKTVTLGPRILRTETAGIAVLSQLNYILN